MYIIPQMPPAREPRLAALKDVGCRQRRPPQVRIFLPGRHACGLAARPGGRGSAVSETGGTEARGRSSMLLVLLAALIFGALAMRRTGVAVFTVGVSLPLEEDYCVTCGLIRNRTAWRATFRDTEFTRVYHRHVSSRCRHKWQDSLGGRRLYLYGGGSGISLHGPGLAWYLEDVPGSRSPLSPLVPGRRSPLSSLEGFTDSTRVARVLAALRKGPYCLPSRPSSPAQRAMLDAVFALPSATTPAQQEQWWRKYHHLF